MPKLKLMSKKEAVLYRHQRSGSRSVWAGFFDPLAVKAVSIVTDHLSKDGKLYAQGGIDAATAIRDLLADSVTDSFWSKDDHRYRLAARRFKLKD